MNTSGDVTERTLSEASCTWPHEDGTICGKPADAFRVQWLPEKTTWYYCAFHIAVLRRMASDAEAKAAGVETYAVAA